MDEEEPIEVRLMTGKGGESRLVFAGDDRKPSSPCLVMRGRRGARGE
jgi:hypothetical protein